MGIFSKIASGIGGALTGFISGGPVGAIIGGAAGLFGGSRSRPAPAPVARQISTAMVPIAPLRAVSTGGLARRAALDIGPTGPFSGATGMFGGELQTIELCRTVKATPLAMIQKASGRRVSHRQLMQIVRVCGIDFAAESLNVDARIICQAIVTRRSRRSRGISAGDLRRTRSTIRKINNMASQLAQLAGPARRRSLPRPRSS